MKEHQAPIKVGQHRPSVRQFSSMSPMTSTIILISPLHRGWIPQGPYCMYKSDSPMKPNHFRHFRRVPGLEISGAPHLMCSVPKEDRRGNRRNTKEGDFEPFRLHTVGTLRWKWSSPLPCQRLPFLVRWNLRWQIGSAAPVTRWISLPLTPPPLFSFYFFYSLLFYFVFVGGGERLVNMDLGVDSLESGSMGIPRKRLDRCRRWGWKELRWR